MKSTAEYVIELAKEYRSDFDYAFRCALPYAKLMNRAPQLGDFVPCKDGKVLEIEDCSCLATNNRSHICPASCYKDYRQALDRCIFEGFEVVETDTDYIQLRSKELKLDVQIDSGTWSYSKWNDDWTNVSDSFRITRIEQLPLELKEVK